MARGQPIDINCDMGESYGSFTIGQDAAILPYVQSCSIACGFHGGDPLHIQTTIDLALHHGVRIGAHPGFPDLQGFGRRPMNLARPELVAMIRYQIAALSGMVAMAGGTMAFVKPHGALYNQAAHDRPTAEALFEAVAALDSRLPIMLMAGAPIELWAVTSGIPFLREAFLDRRYAEAGRLLDRSEPGAVIDDLQDAAEQFCDMIDFGRVRTRQGYIDLEADSFCVHGDHASCLDVLRAVHRALGS